MQKWLVEALRKDAGKAYDALDAIIAEVRAFTEGTYPDGREYHAPQTAEALLLKIRDLAQSGLPLEDK